MKETRYFYCPDALTCNELPPEEATHAVRVLRLKAGDEIFLINGKGCFFKVCVSLVTNRRCVYDITEKMPQEKTWNGSIHLAIAPTKNIDRIEWMSEKITEIGFDHISFLDCKFSERKQIRIDRIEKIIISSVKQSRKAFMPKVDGIMPFKAFIDKYKDSRGFIAHCYNEIPRVDLLSEMKLLPPKSDIIIMIGPEGDFSIDEVQYAIDRGFKSISLGKSRLRTETAGLMSVAISQIIFRK